jgi:hypothetical protein
MRRMSGTGRAVIGAAVLAAALGGCGDAQNDGMAGAREAGKESSAVGLDAWPARPDWSVHTDGRWGYVISIPPGWQMAERSLTPSLIDPVEILTVATFSLRPGDGLCAALASIAPDEALVTIQERGRGAYGSPSFPPRPARFRADPTLPGQSTWPYCVAGDDGPPIPMLDYWFGFGDAGRAFHVFVGIGEAAAPEIRRDAFRILDSLRLDPNVEPDWQSAGYPR